VQGQQPVGDERLALTLQLERELLGLDSVSHELGVSAPRRTSPGAGVLLQAAATLTASPVARRSLVPTTTSPVLTPIRASTPSSGARRASRRGPDGAERVVLVHLGDAEDGHDRVADELLHGAAVALDDCLHLVEVAAEERPQRLRVD
jgi:hypothetical protein